jgi:L-threonylcarbamoyladenylate synthase
MEVSYHSEIEKAIPILEAGGIILYPTDTIWGIGCDATNPSAIKKIYALKKRPDKKAMIILVADEKDIYKYVKDPSEKVFEYLKHAEKPTTVIYNNAINLPSELLSEDNSIAIRIVQDDFCKDLIREIGNPIVSTSANLSGDKSPFSFNEINEEIQSGVDYIVKYRTQEVMHAASSIIRLNSAGAIEVIRL